MGDLKLYDAELKDAELVFKWRNDPQIITKGSLNREVPWEEHKNWFNSLIEDPARHMYIIKIHNEPAGQVRFTVEAESGMAEISIYILQDYIGQGYGVKALTKACDDIASKLNITGVIAYILQGNEQSERAFKKAGFAPWFNCDMNEGTLTAKDGHSVYCLTL